MKIFVYLVLKRCHSIAKRLIFQNVKKIENTQNSFCITARRRSSGASAISEGDIFIYSCSAQLISVEVDSISKEINCAEHEYMNMSPSLIALAPLLRRRWITFFLYALYINNVKLILGSINCKICTRQVTLNSAEAN